MKNRIHFVLLIFFSLQLYGEEENITLTQNSNYYIKQIKNGLVFIGSKDGLNVYDGNAVKSYKPRTHKIIGTVSQSDFFEDASGNVWFANHGAVNVYSEANDDFQAFQYSDSLTGKLIVSDYRVVYLQGDTLWTLAEDYTILFDIQRKKEIARFRSEVSKLHQFEVVKKKSSYFFISGGTKGLKIIELDLNFKIINSYTHLTNIHSLTFKNDCNIYYATSNGDIIEFDFCLKKEICKRKVSKNSIAKIELYKNNLLVMDSRKGIFLYDFDNNIKLNYLLSSDEAPVRNPVFCTFDFSIDNTLWYCIDGYGCNYKQIESYIFDNNIKNKFHDNAISLIVGLGKNKQCVFLRNNGFIVQDSTQSTILEFVPPEKSNISKNVDAALKLNNGNVLFSIDKLFFELSDQTLETKQIYQSTYPTFSDIKSMVQVGDHILLLGSDRKLYEFEFANNNVSITELHFKNLDNELTTGIQPVNDFEFLVSYDDVQLKLGHIKGSNEIEITGEYDISGELKCVQCTTNDLCLVSTSSGLYQIDRIKQSFKPIIDEDLILEQTIYSIIPYSEDCFWLSSNTGLIHFNRSTDQAILFNKDRGLEGNEFNTNSYSIDPVGRLFFGSQNGLVYFHPDSIRMSSREAKVYISNFSVNGERLPEQSPNKIKNLKLNCNQNQLAFDFHAIDYAYGNAKIKYRLEGVNSKWIISRNNSASIVYPDLPPGSYTFSILGANADGVWNPKPRNINITILPPWYATWWARILGLLLMAGITYLTFRTYYKRQLREKDLQLREKNLIISKQQALAEERTRIAAEMHDDLGGGLTTIRFLSQKVLVNSKDQTIKTHVAKIVQQSETLVNNMSEIIWAMNAGFDTLQSLISYSRRYANRYFEHYEMDLKFEVIGSTKNIKINGAKRRNIFLTIKEAFHNAVKHSKAKNVSVLFVVDGTLSIKIKDDGVGIQKMNELGNGFRNMKTRMNNINGSLSFENNDGLEIVLNVPLQID